MATATLPSRTTAFKASGRAENFFFCGMALLMLATVLVGFARTYFLAGVFRAPLPATIIHVHGAVFTSWVLLFITQTSLVAAGRVDIHRKLGMFGFSLACLMVVVGWLAATNSLSRGVSPPGSGLDSKTFYAVPLGAMLSFSILVFFAFRARSNPAAHKRLILMATIGLMGAPTARPPFAAITGRPPFGPVFIWLFLLLLVGYDLWSTHKVQRATIWGGLFLVIITQIAVPIGMTGAWHSFATWAVTLPHF
jgi:hypothetical protein